MPVSRLYMVFWPASAMQRSNNLKSKTAEKYFLAFYGSSSKNVFNESPFPQFYLYFYSLVKPELLIFLTKKF